MFDGGGNVAPQLRTAQALRGRGVLIHVLGHRDLRDRVEAAGFSFEPFTAGRHFEPTAQRSLATMMAEFAAVVSDRGFGRCAVDLAHREGCDAIVIDMIFVAGVAEVMASGMPTVVFVHCFYRGVQDVASGPVGWLLRAHGVSPSVAERGDVLQIVSARADLDSVRGSPPVRHVGVVWQGTPKPAVPTDPPRILVTLSTCAYAGQRRMLQRILDAVAPLAAEVVVTVGPSIDASGLRLPSNAAVHAWLDHDEVLATASLVVSHGGHSTAMRALSFGVPLVILPANPLIDQRRVGIALQRSGLGIHLPKHSRTQRIRAAVETVLTDQSYQRAAARLGEQIRERDGAEVAADAIEDYVRTRAPVGRHR
jgi:UDP:flavonoid glycosyltransferase YjiC (YdhE family)